MLDEKTTIDALVEELKNDPNMQNSNSTKPPPFEITPENVEKYILEKANRLIINGLDSIEEIKDAIKQGIDSDEILAYSDLIKATTGALETLNKINLQKQKIEATAKLKELDRLKGPTSNTNILITTREDIMKKLLDSSSEDNNPTNEEPIDITVEVNPND